MCRAAVLSASELRHTASIPIIRGNGTGWHQRLAADVAVMNVWSCSPGFRRLLKVAVIRDPAAARR